MAVTVNTINQ